LFWEGEGVRFRKLLLAVSLVLLPAYGAAASTIATLDLSDRSSEDTPSLCAPNCYYVPTRDELDATLTFTVADNGPDLDITLTLSNDTDEAPAGTFDINEVYFNTSGLDLTGVSLNGWSMAEDYSGTSSSTKADGFGYFDVALTAGSAVTAGNSISFTFTATGAAGTQAEAFTTDLSRDAPTPGLLLSYAAAKFVNGPQVTCPGGENICDSGFGANIPEPTTALLLLGGLSGMAAWRRRLH
jgi:hypothetical protein